MENFISDLILVMERQCWSTMQPLLTMEDGTELRLLGNLRSHGNDIYWLTSHTWHIKFHLQIFHVSYRTEQTATLKVDDGHIITGASPGKLRQLNGNGQLFIGKTFFLNRILLLFYSTTRSIMKYFWFYSNTRRHRGFGIFARKYISKRICWMRRRAICWPSIRCRHDTKSQEWA